MKKSLLALAGLLLTAGMLSGCASSNTFKNEVFCNSERGAFISWYSKIGIAAQLDPKDCVVMQQVIPAAASAPAK